MKHKIAIDISVLDITKTGSTVYVIELIDAIKTMMPDDLEIITLRAPKPIKRRILLRGLFNIIIQLFWLNIQIPLLVLKHRIEVLHLPTNMIPFLAPCKVIASILDANFVRFPETYNYWWGTYAKFQFAYAAKHADKVITISENSKNDIIKYFGAKPNSTEVIYLGSRSFPVSVENNTSYGSYILFVGAVYPSKNIPRLIKAYHKFIARNSKNSDCNLVIAGGDGPEFQNIEDLVKDLGLSEKVFFTGHISDNELSTLYKYAKLFAFPSLNEGFGFPPIEAMANNIPVVSSTGGSLPEILGTAAVYFDPLSVDDIADKIELVMTDTELRSKMIDRGRLQARKYTWKKCAEQHLRVYREFLSATNT